MNYREEAIRFACAGETLVAILARPERPAELGVVVVVGGPQTRVGSHREFVLLSRTLASAGYASLRFDYRGMGDSTGDHRHFTEVTADIGTAIEALRTACPAVTKIALWGLCDAASASLLYWGETRDERVSGFCLLNPWVRSEATLARTHVKHYYGQRLLDKAFWQKLASGKVDLRKALRGFATSLRLARSAQENQSATANMPFQNRMALALREFPGKVLLILSGNDYTAKEFLETANSDPAWSEITASHNMDRHELPEADHTFSSAKWRGEVEQITTQWLQGLAKPQ